jgi:hypothetical protein
MEFGTLLRHNENDGWIWITIMSTNQASFCQTPRANCPSPGPEDYRAVLPSQLDEFQQENGKMTTICKPLREDISSVCESMIPMTEKSDYLEGTIKTEQHCRGQNSRIST